jgi:uncharacterized protein
MKQDTKKKKRRRQRAARIQNVKSKLDKKGEFYKLKDFNQHGSTSVHTHVVNVAWWAETMADHLPFEFNHEDLIQSALLHDYFLYDWHEEHESRPHGFTHPFIAANNAKEHYEINENVQKAIKTHMWPLTIMPPLSREGWLVTIADKIATYEETLGKRRPKKKTAK